MRIGSITHQFVPVETRVPLKFGTETLTSVTCSRIRLEARGSSGSRITGWGETPLSVQWVWPSALSYAERQETLMAFSESLVAAWTDWEREGDALELGHDLVFEDLPKRLDAYNAIERKGREPMPWLAALVCASPIDLALHDAFGQSLGRPTYACYDGESLAHDLSRYLEPAEDSKVRFAGRYPSDYLLSDLPESLPVWHLVGGLDPLDSSELRGDEPDDGYPVHLREWIRRDGLSCLKIKLRGNDSEWDYRRLLEVGRISAEEGVDHLSTDFNCTVTEPAYVNDILDRLAREDSSTNDRILYVEQPFPYDLEMHRIPVHSLADRKALFMDESAHDWKHVRLGRELGWTGVALKTCKTQTGALLSLCWAKAHGMSLMVQDLTNPMLAQIPHVLLGHHAGTIMGVESNGMQFYPDASIREARVHPGLYTRREGRLDLSTIRGPGFGYRMEEIEES